MNKKTVETFENIYDFVRQNKKFPNFETEFGVKSNWIEKYGKTLNFQFWFQRDYYRNCKKLEKLHGRKKLENKAEILGFLKKAIQYQRANYVFPIRANWFNDNSEAIFAHLEGVNF